VTEAIAFGGLILSVVVGVIRETQFRRQRSNRIDAEAALDNATAANTITETVKGLLIVLDDRLKTAEVELLACRRELEAEKQRTRDLTAEVERLEAHVTVLMASGTVQDSIVATLARMEQGAIDAKTAAAEVAHDLADSIERADSMPKDGNFGVAADAALRSAEDDQPDEPTEDP
jgi:hypothetical protein